MTVNLGQLASNTPVPTGVCQIKRGAGSTDMTFNNTVAQGTVITDGAGQPMRISVTPTNPGWWVIRAESVWSSPDAVWRYWTWYVGISPTDADGVTGDWNHGCTHSITGYRESCLNTIFRLNANTTYSATMTWGYSQGNNQRIWPGTDFLYIMGEFVGEGQI
jgi:hypothetical protein